MIGCMEEWKEYKLEEVTSILGDGIHGTPKYDDEGSIFFINGNNLENGKIVIKENTKRVSSEEAIKHSRPLSNRTILVSINGTLGNVAKYNGESCILGKSACYFNVNEDVDLDFIYYVVANNQFKDTITRLATGTTIKNVSLKTMREYSFLMPSKETQKRVSAILKSLDDKIEVNRRINEQLEELAQALFKSWFVDFEPFKDGEFVESELGMIPKGWKVGTLGDVAMITKGTTPTTLGYSFTYNGIPFIKAESIRDNHTIDFDKTTYISSEANEKLCRSIIKKYDILFTIAGTLGRFCFAPQTLEIANTNQAVAIIRVHKLFNPISIYSMLLGKWHTEYCYRNIQQAVQANLSLGTLKKMPILIPPFDIIKKYEECIFPIFMKFESLNEEITHLTNLRDTLLPKLMSGEIDVNEVEI